MAETKPQAESNSNTLTPLAHALKHIDRPTDSRSCPHDDCPGSLTLTDDDRVVCSLCRTTPDGVYLEPTTPNSSENVNIGGQDDPFFYRRPARWFATRYPWGERWEDRPPEHYTRSGQYINPGGFEAPYDEDDERRPNGVTADYSFDLSTY